MGWLQLRLDCDQSAAADLEAELLQAGALSVTLEDRGDEPLLEPGVGETPLWRALRISGLFPADHDLQTLLARFESRHDCSARVELLEDKDWEREWMRHYRPMRFGERLWICPSWQDPPEPDAVNLLLDPGLAFGTGTHPTTALCLEAIDDLAPAGARTVDFGCGSGILGIAALRLGAAELLCVDNDPQALSATLANAGRNGIDPTLLQVCLPGAYDAPHWRGRCDLVLANILAGPLAQLAGELCDFLAPGGRLILAGLLDTQVDELVSAYAPRIALAPLSRREQWVCLGGIRGPGPSDPG